MTILLNGKSHETDEATQHVADLLEELQIAGQPVLVEHNGSALFPRDFQTTPLMPNDSIELIRIVAGG